MGGARGGRPRDPTKRKGKEKYERNNDAKFQSLEGKSRRGK